MNPMVRGGSITVNPMGVPVPVQQKPWLKFALMNLHEDMPDDLIKKLIGSLGKVVSFNRLENQKTKVKATYCIFQYSCGEDVVRITKFWKDVKMLDRVLDLKISQDTNSFLRQWMNIQKEEWKKKSYGNCLNNLASGSVEMRKYDSLQAYLQRDDKTIQDRFNNALRDVTNDLRKVLQSKQKQDERKEHPKEKERDRKKRQLKEQIEKKYSIKMEYWLLRQKSREKIYKRETERNRDKEKLLVRKLEREMDLTQEEIKQKTEKFLTKERKQEREKELDNDLKNIELEWLPPEPELLVEVLAPQEEAPEEVIRESKQRALHTFTVQEQKLHPSATVEMSDLMQLQKSEVKKQKSFTPNINSSFSQVQVVEKAKPVSLNLPALESQQKDKMIDPAKGDQIKKKEMQLFKLYKQIPRNKQGLWQYEIQWEIFNQNNVFERKIRPWLFKTCTRIFGQADQKFIALIQKLLLKKSTPDKLLKMLSNALDVQAQKFVMDLWVEIIFSILKVINKVDQF